MKPLNLNKENQNKNLLYKAAHQCDAIIALLVGCGRATDQWYESSGQIYGWIVGYKHLLDGIDAIFFFKKAIEWQIKYGSLNVIEGAARAVDEENKLFAFWFCAETVFSKGKIFDKEIATLMFTAEQLGIEEMEVNSALEYIKVKFKYHKNLC